jgi:predicted lipid-binding transport protein (Tim44 family)
MKMIFLMMFSISLLATTIDADAKRMGGGSSIGRQSNTVTRNQNALPPKPVAPPVNAAPKPNPSPTAAAPTPSRFGGIGGILGGLAAGIGLSYLFSHMGMGEGMASMFSNILMIGALVFIGLWLFRKFAGKNISSMMSPSPAGSAPWSANSAQDSQTSTSITPTATVMAPSHQLPLIPEASDNMLKSPIHAALTPQAFTDKETFLENAKTLKENNIKLYSVITDAFTIDKPHIEMTKDLLQF